MVAPAILVEQCDGRKAMPAVLAAHPIGQVGAAPSVLADRERRFQARGCQARAGLERDRAAQRVQTI